MGPGQFGPGLTRQRPSAHGEALQLAVVRHDEVDGLLEELVEGWRPCQCQQRMIVSRELDEARALDQSRDIPPLLERRNTVARAVKDQSGGAHPFRQLGHFHLGIHLPKPQRVLRARRDPLELVEAGATSGGASGMKFEVKKCRNTGLGEPQPSRIIMVNAS